MHCVLGNANANVNGGENGHATRTLMQLEQCVVWKRCRRIASLMLGDLASRVMVHARSPPSLSNMIDIVILLLHSSTMKQKRIQVDR